MGMSKESENEIVNPDQIMELAFSFQRSRVFLTGYELGLFSALSDREKTSEEVAGAVGTEARATDRLLNALCAMGLLGKREGQFFNTPLTSRFLVKGKPEYMGGLMHIVHLWDTWNTLTQAVRQGRSVVAEHVNERGEKWLDAFIAAMHERARRNAPNVVSLLDLSNVYRVLDVGGGSGAYSMAFAQAREGVTATVFDLPNVIPLTRKYIDQEQLSSRVKTAIGDYHTSELGREFDLVFLSAVIHINSCDENRNLIRKASRALNPGGQIVIQDFIMDEDRTAPAFGTLFSLNMLVGTEAGDTYTESEVRSWMGDAGLSQIERKDTEFGTTLIIGKK